VLLPQPINYGDGMPGAFSSRASLSIANSGLAADRVDKVSGNAENLPVIHVSSSTQLDAYAQHLECENANLMMRLTLIEC